MRRIKKEIKRMSETCLEVFGEYDLQVVNDALENGSNEKIIELYLVVSNDYNEAKMYL